MERPEFLICLAGRHVLEIGPAGKLRDLLFAAKTYARFSTQDVLAVTWQVYTQAQLEQLAEQEAAAMGVAGEVKHG